MPIPTEKIIEAAKREGFATELQTASIAIGAGWRTNENVYYIDKDENKGRELDLSMYRLFCETSQKPEVTCMITLCVEVKRTQDPFIFFCSDQKDQYEGSAGYGIFNWNRNIDRFVLSFQDIDKLRPMSKPVRLARSYTSFKTGKAQHIQSGIISAFKAAIHAKNACNEAYSNTSGEICFFIPIVVVDGPMYQCFYDKSNELVAEEVQNVVYKQNYHSPNYGRVSSNVLVIDINFFKYQLSKFDRWGEHILSVMIQNRDKVKGV